MPTYVDTILCEAVRPEANNKLSLLGVFGNAILVPKVPTQLALLAIVQRWEPLPEEPPGTNFGFGFEIRGPGIASVRFPDQPVVVASGPRPPQLVVIVQIQGLVIPQQGDYAVATFINGQGSHIYTFYVGLPSNEQQEKFIGFR